METEKYDICEHIMNNTLSNSPGIISQISLIISMHNNWNHPNCITNHATRNLSLNIEYIINTLQLTNPTNTFNMYRWLLTIPQCTAQGHRCRAIWLALITVDGTAWGHMTRHVSTLLPSKAWWQAAVLTPHDTITSQYNNPSIPGLTKSNHIVKHLVTIDNNCYFSSCHFNSW